MIKKNKTTLKNVSFSKKSFFLEVKLNSIRQISTTNQQTKNISSSQVFDINEFSDKTSKFKNMMPQKHIFKKFFEKYPVDSSIILYETQGVYSSPRALLMLHSIGYKNVYIVNNKVNDIYDYAKNDLLKIDSNSTNLETIFCNKDFVKRAIKNKEEFQIIDARSEDRFNGVSPEPHKNLKSGHIPTSINLPYEKLITDGKYIETSKIKKIFKDLNISK
jgi:thiosulfate/3-mercaptopyruvate sulfurtransferase